MISSSDGDEEQGAAAAEEAAARGRAGRAGAGSALGVCARVHPWRGRYGWTVARAEDPLAAAAQRLQDATVGLAADVRSYNKFRLCEGVRMACLPWSADGQSRPGTEGGATKAELLALISMAGRADEVAQTEEPLSPRLTSFAERAHELINLSTVEHILAAAAAEEPDPMAAIVAASRGREVWIPNSSYPDMVQETVAQIFDPPVIRHALRDLVGFDAEQAILALTTCHTLQVDAFNDRMRACFMAIDEAMADGAEPDDDERSVLRAQWDATWEPDELGATVALEDVVAAAGLEPDVVRAVAEQFRLEVDDWTPVRAVREFTSGNNPLRTNPLLVTRSGRMMLVHDALTLNAVRENLEQVLKTSAAWEQYQAHRGKVLEHRISENLARVVPDARTWEGFEYFAPATPEEAAGDPATYSKLVEGDLLVVKGDVAVIVEAKAVTLAPRARAGDTRRLRSDLTRIVKSAGDQGRRLKSILQKDLGFRTRANEWVDLPDIREIHTVAVSLDDLSGVATTTQELVLAGLLDPLDVPWTVSLHDLQLICDLVDLPSEFLLYVRRRRDPETTHYYLAPDELDYFIYFLEAGLYVEPDPRRSRRELGFVKVRATDVKRRERQKRQYLTSRTDALDAWYYAKRDGRTDVPKPAMQKAQMKGLVRQLQELDADAWLSIGATLLSASGEVQAELLRASDKLLAAPDPLGRGRSMTISLGSTRQEAWVLVWAGRPTAVDPAVFADQLRSYLTAKKYQLRLDRGCIFVFDESTKMLVDVVYDGLPFRVDPEMDAVVAASGLIDPAQSPRRLPQGLR
ncbi:hypothetical protein ACWCOV_10050 [Kribbella sp. NPDC002412]